MAFGNLDDILEEIQVFHELVLGEAKDQAEARKAARTKKEKRRKQKEAAARARGEHAEAGEQTGKTLTKKLKSGEAHKKDLPKGASVEKGKVKIPASSSKFSNDTTLRPTPEDSHVHTDNDKEQGLRARTEKGKYADDTNKRYPLFPGRSQRARILGSLNAAYRYKNKEALRKLIPVAKAMGINPTGGMWYERTACKTRKQQEKAKADGRKVKFTVSAKACKPHGEGGPDEYLRGEHSKSSHSKKAESAKSRFGKYEYVGHRDSAKEGTKGFRLPGKYHSKSERAFASGGGVHGDWVRGALRNIPQKYLDKHGLSKDAGPQAATASYQRRVLKAVKDFKKGQ